MFVEGRGRTDNCHRGRIVYG